MKLVFLAIAFLVGCWGIVANATIPLLFALARKHEEVAGAISVDTQYKTHRYNSILGYISQVRSSQQKPPNAKSQGSNVIPLGRDKNGPRKDDGDLR